MGSEDEEPSGGRRAVTWVVVPVVVGVVVAVAPMWVTLGNGMEPAGPRCWFEIDPASGRSSLGEERIEWGIAPHRACEPPEGAAGVAEASDRNRTFAIYGRAWPLVAAFVTAFVWLVLWQRRVDRDTLDAMEDPDL